MLSKEEGGRHTPFFNGYRPQFYFRTTDVTGVAKLPEGTEMVMPGDNVDLAVELIAPIAMEKGCASRFARAAAPSAPASSPKSSSRSSKNRPRYQARAVQPVIGIVANGANAPEQHLGQCSSSW